MKRYFVAAAIFPLAFLIAFAGRNTAQAQETASAASVATTAAIYHPRLLPTSPFYFIKRLKEDVEMAFTFSPEKKAEKRLEFATHRLAEANAIAKKHPKLAQKLMDRYQKQLQKMQDRLQKLPPEKRMQALEKINQAMRRHARVWRHIENKLPPAAKKRVKQALQRSIKGHQRAIEAIRQHLDKLPPQVRQRVEKKQQRLEKELDELENVASKTDKLKVKDALRLRRIIRRRHPRVSVIRQRHMPSRPIQHNQLKIKVSPQISSGKTMGSGTGNHK